MERGPCPSRVLRREEGPRRRAAPLGTPNPLKATSGPFVVYGAHWFLLSTLGAGWPDRPYPMFRQSCRREQFASRTFEDLLILIRELLSREEETHRPNAISFRQRAGRVLRVDIAHRINIL
jgi:hypothetical protein